MAQSKIKAILFDKDGVLVDFQKTYGIATREIISRLSNLDTGLQERLAVEVGFDLSNNTIHPQSPLVAGYSKDFCGIWAGILGIANDRAFQARIDLAFMKLTEANVVLIDGVGAVLERLKPDYHLGIATNDTEQCARSQLTNSGLIRYLDYIAGYDSGHGAKPGTGMAVAFIQQMQVKPREVVMVGDSVHDMYFARDAGMTAIGVSTGPLPGERLAPHCDFFINSLSELPELLTNL